ncbi:MAG: cell wall hydrolase [Chakrabartia sp.]
MTIFVSNYKNKMLKLAAAVSGILLLAGNAVSKPEMAAPSPVPGAEMARPANISAADLTKMEAAPQDTIAPVGVDPREAECIAKVIVHEAANQPYKGQLAVAQVITNRMKNPRFPKTACAVVNQPRQFFNVDGYNPSRSTRAWQTALEIAHDVLQERTERVVADALYFNGVGGGMPGRTAMLQIGDHVFYR